MNKFRRTYSCRWRRRWRTDGAHRSGDGRITVRFISSTAAGSFPNSILGENKEVTVSTKLSKI
uniref:Putative ovule protein n=1 Tax=Solanum chacoense TaxID=4108 RepID=A0A0V0GT36_SOLCH